MKNLILRLLFPIIVLLCVGLFFVLIYNTQYVGYGIKSDDFVLRPTPISNVIKTLFVGRMNAFSRKHIL